MGIKRKSLVEKQTKCLKLYTGILLILVAHLTEKGKIGEHKPTITRKYTSVNLIFYYYKMDYLLFAV